MSNEAHKIKVIMDCLKALEKNTIGGLPEKIQGDITTHAFIAAGSSFIPVPGASAAANVANIWAMYARINSDIGITFSKNILKTVASGVVANLGGYVVLLGAGELLKFIPVFGSFVGAAIESGIAYAITIVSAYVYIKAITLMARKRIDFNNEEKLQHEVDEILRNDKEEIKAMLKEAKNSYKPQK